MILSLYTGLILLFFILAFAVKNVKTFLSTGVSIRGKSIKLSLSILLSTLLYVLIGLRIVFMDSATIFEIESLQIKSARSIGLILVGGGFLLGVAALIQMKDSWRVGIKYDQKTTLITSGIYRISRNPYFLSYNVLIMGYIFIFPSPLLFFPYLLLVYVFHKMILEEEKYLENTHGDSYFRYKKKVGRYFTSKI